MDLVASLPPELLQRALTHSSWVGERTGSYERLEFLGDSVLGLAIASVLYSRFPDREEGGLARLKAFVVSRSELRAGSREDRRGFPCPRARPRFGAEAARSRAQPQPAGRRPRGLVGAVFLEYGFERVRPAIIAVFEEQISYAATAHVDHKTTLQELLAPRGLQPGISPGRRDRTGARPQLHVGGRRRRHRARPGSGHHHQDERAGRCPGGSGRAAQRRISAWTTLTVGARRARPASAGGRRSARNRANPLR